MQVEGSECRGEIRHETEEIKLIGKGHSVFRRYWGNNGAGKESDQGEKSQPTINVVSPGAISRWKKEESTNGGTNEPSGLTGRGRREKRKGNQF